MKFTIRDLLWLTVVACVIAASIGRERQLVAKGKDLGRSWDVYERIHDHMSEFHGVVQANTSEEAMAAAQQKYGPKVHVRPYERQGFVAPLSDYDLGCYRQ